KTIGSSMKNWTLALLYIAAIATGLFAISLMADPFKVLNIIANGTISSLNASDLKRLKQDVNDKLIKKLESLESRRSIEELGTMLINFKEQHFPNFDFKVVGHSLGGVIAELCAVKVGLECITFESPGSLEILDNLSEYKDKPRKVFSYLSAPNIINTLNHHPGTIYRVKLPHTDGFSMMHAANCVAQTA